MPNDCYNIIDSITHDDATMINLLKECLKKDPPVFFAEFIPCPANETCTSYWGTKWDVYDVSVNDSDDDLQLSLSFYTAWSPPFAAYTRLQQLGFTIHAKFMECGMDFCGYWDDRKEMVYTNVYENLNDVPEEFHYYFKNDEDDDEEEEEEK